MSLKIKVAYACSYSTPEICRCQVGILLALMVGVQCVAIVSTDSRCCVETVSDSCPVGVLSPCRSLYPIPKCLGTLYAIQQPIIQTKNKTKSLFPLKLKAQNMHTSTTNNLCWAHHTWRMNTIYMIYVNNQHHNQNIIVMFDVISYIPFSTLM